MPIKIENRSNYYKPSTSLLNGLSKILQYEKVQLEYGKRSTHKKLSTLQIKERGNVIKAKHDVSQKIFVSVTNLLYFFEFIAEHDLVHKVFEKDIMSMCGARKAPDKFFRDVNSSVMTELMDAVMLHRNFGPTNFRMPLLEYMQYTITQIISSMSISELNDEVSTQIVSQDMGRALAWVKLFVHNPKKETERKKQINQKRKNTKIK